MAGSANGRRGTGTGPSLAGTRYCCRFSIRFFRSRILVCRQKSDSCNAAAAAGSSAATPAAV